MASHAPHPVEHPQDHEHSDVNIRGIVITVVVLVLIAVVAHVLLYYMFDALENRQRRSEVPQTGLQKVQKLAAPEPRLQGVPGFHTNTPRQDMVQMNLDARKHLASYGPAQESGFARIPIDRALDLVLQNDLLKAPPQPKGAPNAR